MAGTVPYKHKLTIFLFIPAFCIKNDVITRIIKNNANSLLQAIANPPAKYAKWINFSSEVLIYLITKYRPAKNAVIPYVKEVEYGRM